MTVNPNAERDRAAWRAFREPAEGALSLDPDDAGNWYDGELVGSKYGVTGGTLEIYLGRHVTAEDMAALTVAEADDIADDFFWKPAAGDFLLSGVNVMTVDFGWNTGVLTATRMVQQAVGFTGRDVDGIIGPKTLLAVRGMGAIALINALHDRQKAHYVRLGGRFLRGWINRDDNRHALALKLACA